MEDATHMKCLMQWALEGHELSLQRLWEMMGPWLLAFPRWGSAPGR